MEKRRGRREIEVTRRRKGGIKRVESKLASNHFTCAPQSGPLRDVHRVIQRREEGGRRQRWEEDKKCVCVWGGIKRRETDAASNQFPKCSPLSGTHW